MTQKFGKKAIYGWELTQTVHHATAFDRKYQEGKSLGWFMKEVEFTQKSAKGLGWGYTDYIT